MVEQTLRTSETITHWALASNLQRTVSHKCMTRDCFLVTTCPDYLLPHRIAENLNLQRHACGTRVSQTKSVNKTCSQMCLSMKSQMEQ